MSSQQHYPSIDPNYTDTYAIFAPDDFQWVSVSGSPAKLCGDRESQKIIKSHVMRRYRRLEKSNLNNGGLALNSKRKKHQSSRQGQELERLDTISSKSWRKIASKVKASLLAQEQPPTNTATSPMGTSIDSGFSDPFDSLAVVASVSTSILLKHYFTNFYKNCVPINRTYGWIKYVVSDKLAMQALLALSAVHYMFTTNDDAFAQLQYHTHTASAISVLNEAMSSPQDRYKDGVAAAMAYLATAALALKKPDESNMHLSAIARVVKARGGFQNLGMDGMLMRFILWADRLYTFSTLTPPRFTPSHTLTSSSVPSLLRYLKAFSSSMSTWPSKSEYARQKYSESLPLLEQFLATIFCHQSKHQSFFIAVHLYIYQVLRMVPSPPDTFKNQVVILKEGWLALLAVEDDENPSQGFIEAANMLVEKSDATGNGRASEADIRLWTLFAGGVSSKGMTDQSWFLEKLGDMCEERALHNWDEVKECLVKVAWVQLLCGDRWRSLWKESQRYISKSAQLRSMPVQELR